MSTPATSFSSEERHRKQSRGVLLHDTPPLSPRYSDTASAADDHSTETDSDSDVEERTKDQIAFDEIIKVVSKQREGIHTEGVDSNPTFHLSRKQRSYTDLLRRLQHCGLLQFFEGLRLRWDADSGELVLILMADPIQECFKTKFDYGLTFALNRIAETTPALADLIKDIDLGAHSPVQKADLSARSSPDGQVYFGVGILSIVPLLIAVSSSSHRL